LLIALEIPAKDEIVRHFRPVPWSLEIVYTHDSPKDDGCLCQVVSHHGGGPTGSMQCLLVSSAWAARGAPLNHELEQGGRPISLHSAEKHWCSPGTNSIGVATARFRGLAETPNVVGIYSVKLSSVTIEISVFIAKILPHYKDKYNDDS
jgi:hypothetical protein